MLASNSGNSIGLWSKGSFTSPGELWGARIMRGGDWEAPQVIVQSSNPVEPLDLRLSSSSEGLAVWVDGTFGGGSRQFRSAQLANGKWRQMQDVSGVADVSLIPYPFTMVMKPSGDAVAVWSQTDTGSVWSNQYVSR